MESVEGRTTRRWIGPFLAALLGLGAVLASGCGDDGSLEEAGEEMRDEIEDSADELVDEVDDAT